MSRERLVPEDTTARQPREEQGIIRLLIARIEELEARVKEPGTRLNKIPQDSSLPPSSQHPHAKPAQPRQPSEKKRGGKARSSRSTNRLTEASLYDNLNRAYKSQQYDIAPSTGTGHQLEALEMPYS